MAKRSASGILNDRIKVNRPTLPRKSNAVRRQGSDSYKRKLSEQLAKYAEVFLPKEGKGLVKPASQT